MKKQGARAITEILVQYVGQSVDDASWGELYILQQAYPHLVSRRLKAT